MPSTKLRQSPRRTPTESYFTEINEMPLLDAAQERALAERIFAGDREAREHMVRANLRLVVRIARSFAGRGLCLQDLVQEGNLGLLRAVEGFDPDMGNRFSTYAGFWIRQSMQRALENTTTAVHVPSYAIDLMNAWRRMTGQLCEELGRAPLDDEVAHRLGLTARQRAILEKALRIYNSMACGDGAESLGELLTDNRTALPDADLAADEELRQVLAMVDQLDDRAATVLRLRFGLSGEAPLTLMKVGERLNLTRERVRQIEREALLQLRSLVCSA